jgi:hypothetical protein
MAHDTVTSSYSIALLFRASIQRLTSASRFPRLHSTSAFRTRIQRLSIAAAFRVPAFWRAFRAYIPVVAGRFIPFQAYVWQKSQVWRHSTNLL